MDVPLLLIADFAGLSQEGKLNVMGVFDGVASKQFPYRHPQLYVVYQIRASVAEQGHEFQTNLMLMGEDGQALLSAKGPMTIPRGEGAHEVNVGQILSFAGIAFEKPGNYSFVLMVNNEEKQRRLLTVAQIEEKK